MSNTTYKAIIKTQGFLPYVVSQFLGALNDNAFKMVLSLMAINQAIYQLDHNGLPIYSSWIVASIGAVFILPYLLFSGYAGYIADVWNKRTVLIVTKAMEIVAMTMALIVLPTGILWLGMIVLFLMATQSTFFSPAKYGILPEVFDDKQLARANGFVEMTTFVAIILGTFAGAALFDIWGEHKGRIGLVMFVIAIVGWIFIWWAPRVEKSGAQKPFPKHPWQEIWWGCKRIFHHKKLRLIVIGIAWFWFLGALLQLTLLVLSKEILHLDDFNTGLIQTVLALGIGIGSLLAGKLSGDRIELGLVPLGALGIGIGATYFAFALPTYSHAIAALIILGLSGGLFLIPLNSSLQQIAGRQEKGVLIATSNFIQTIGILLASATLPICHDIMGISTDNIVMIFGGFTVLVTGVAIYLLPEVLVRFLLWCLTHSIYRIRVRGMDNVPEHGAALLVSNHLSYVDGLLIGAALNRRVRFLLYGGIYDRPLLRPLFKLMKVIPVRSGKRVLESVEEAREALKAGDIVCIFAEGGISRTGNILPFKRGFEKINEGVGAPLIPVHLDEVWGSIFSYSKRRFFFKWPRHFPYPITISFGEALPSDTHTHAVRQKIVELSAEAFPTRASIQTTLPQRFLKSVKLRWFQPCLMDATQKRLSFGQTLVASLLLADNVYKSCKTEQNIGLLFPASIGGALANLSISLLGKVPVNLNFILDQSSLESAINQSEINTILTSRKLVEKFGIKLDAPIRYLYLEDILAELTSRAKVLKTLKALLLPWRVLWWSIPHEPVNPQSVAAILFSSGSTGKPKGIMLSHENILTNLESISQVFPHSKQDRFLGILPFFHSFGFTGTLWFPLIKGLGAIYHHNPLDARNIGKLAKRHQATFLITTPTFVRAYTKICKKEDLASLKYTIVGAEKLRPSIAKEFTEKFGIEIFEGYGCTETGPVVAVNTPNVSKPGWKQRGHKPGTVGTALPGVATRILDPESFALKKMGDSGMLVVKGGNCMLGYLNKLDMTAQAFLDKTWYITGDIAVMDEGGFITIVDRLARFSKIGGEMVPHQKIEDEINNILGGVHSIVVSLPDERKGERLAVVFCHESIDSSEVWSQLNQSTLPKLWVPDRDQFIKVEDLPMLANGKIDLQTAKKLVVAKTA